MISVDAASTSLVLIDLQKGILSVPLSPRTGSDVLATGMAQAQKFRAAGALVTLVNVGWSADFADAPRQPVDEAPHFEGGMPADWSDFADGLAQPEDLRITKRQWGAFHGTELDLQFRRRGITTIVIGGVATNYGVESTVRQAWEQGYEVIVLEDATTTLSSELHAMAFKWIFPRISRVVNSQELSVLKVR